MNELFFMVNHTEDICTMVNELAKDICDIPNKDDVDGLFADAINDLMNAREHLMSAKEKLEDAITTLESL